MADDLGLALQYAGGMFLGAANAAMSYGQHKADRKFNAKQAEIARDWQEKMWNQANEYNTPQQQMQRLTDAGLNPNLVYGNGADTTAAAVPSTEKASFSGGAAPRLEVFQEIAAAKQLELIDAQIERTQAETNLTTERATTQGIVNTHEDARLSAIVQGLELNSEFLSVTFNNRVALNQFELDSAKVDNYVKHLSADYLPEQLEQQLRIGYQNLSNLVASNALTWEQIKNLSTQTWFIGEQVKEVRSAVVRNYAAANASNAAANASNAQAGYYGAMTVTENLMRQPKVQGAYEQAFFTHEQAMRIDKMTDAELAKVIADTNQAVLTGNMKILERVSNRFGSGLVPSIFNAYYNTKSSTQTTVNSILNNPYKPYGVQVGHADGNW